MPRRSQRADPEALRANLEALFRDFGEALGSGDLREKVCSLSGHGFVDTELSPIGAVVRFGRGCARFGERSLPFGSGRRSRA